MLHTPSGCGGGGDARGNILAALNTADGEGISRVLEYGSHYACPGYRYNTLAGVVVGVVAWRNSRTLLSRSRWSSLKEKKRDYYYWNCKQKIHTFWCSFAVVGASMCVLLLLGIARESGSSETRSSVSEYPWSWESLRYSPFGEYPLFVRPQRSSVQDVSSRTKDGLLTELLVCWNIRPRRVRVGGSARGCSSSVLYVLCFFLLKWRHRKRGTQCVLCASIMLREL